MCYFLLVNLLANRFEIYVLLNIIKYWDRLLLKFLLIPLNVSKNIYQFQSINSSFLGKLVAFFTVQNSFAEVWYVKPASRWKGQLMVFFIDIFIVIEFFNQIKNRCFFWLRKRLPIFVISIPYQTALMISVLIFLLENGFWTLFEFNLTTFKSLSSLCFDIEFSVSFLIFLFDKFFFGSNFKRINGKFRNVYVFFF